MTLTRRATLGAVIGATAGAALRPRRARAAVDDVIRIGALTDLSGPYRDVEGPTGTACARQAIAEFTAANPGIRIDVLVADHQNKPDIAATIVRQWFDRDGVDALIQVGNTGVALAVNTIAREKDKVHVNTGALSSSITGKYCTANMVHGPLDTYAMSHSTATALTKDGAGTWYFLTADYAFGHAIQDDTTALLKAAGGKVVGSAAYPFPGTVDFSAFLLQAQASGAKVMGLAGSGADVVNCLKQVKEFGIDRSMKVAGLGAFLSDVMSMDASVAGGLLLTESFYWDRDDRTRAFYSRLKPHIPAGVFPGSLHAGAYAGMTHYLKTVKQMGVGAAKGSGAKTVAVMKQIPTDDDAFGPGKIREDGQMIAPVYLYEVKGAADRHGPGDVYIQRAVTPADQAFRPLAEGGCPLIQKG